MMPRLGEKYDFEIETLSKPKEEYNTDEYFELDLPVAPAVMVGEDIVVEGSDVSEAKLELDICNHLGHLPPPEPEKKGGFVYVWIGAMVGASAAFLIGRNLGREFAASLIGDRLKKYDDGIEHNGFATVLYLRLVYFPFTPMNFGMGLTKVHFWDYFFGTGLGIIVGTFIFLFFIGTLKEVWAGGNWAELLSLKVFFSVGLFILSLFIPKIIKNFKKRYAK